MAAKKTPVPKKGPGAPSKPESQKRKNKNLSFSPKVREIIEGAKSATGIPATQLVELCVLAQIGKIVEEYSGVCPSAKADSKMMLESVKSQLTNENEAQRANQ